VGGGGSPTLDPNLVAAVWGVAALYGVLAGFLISRTDQIYQEYMEKGTIVSNQRAKTWALTTRALPVAAFVTIAVLSLVAVFEPGGVSITRPPGTSFWIILAGVITMVVFTVTIFRLVRKIPQFELPVINCGAGADELRSRDTSLSLTKICLVNEGAAPVQYVWIDRHGNTVEHYRKILDPDGIPRIFETWAGHLWMLQDMDRKCIGVYRAREEPGGVFIKQVISSGALSYPSLPPSC
jgi:hypothetical protein